MPRNLILGISAFHRDSAAALLDDGELVAATQEERFTRVRHDARFPANAVAYCIDVAGVPLSEFDQIAYCGRHPVPPDPAQDRRDAPASALRTELARCSGIRESALPPLTFIDRQQAQAASAFFPSPFQQAAVLCIDGAGDSAPTSAWQGDGSRLQRLWQIDFPDSLGALYSAFTHHLGFKAGSGEYKVMGLAPYGEPRYLDRIIGDLIDLRDDGVFCLNRKYFEIEGGALWPNRRFERLFGGPQRRPESTLEQQHLDMARSIQQGTEEIVLRMAHKLRRETGNEFLCMAGGVALNCVANGRILREGNFRDLWIQPAAAAAGTAPGSAMAAWYQSGRRPRPASPERDRMRGALLGPSFDNERIERELRRLGARFAFLPDAKLMPQLARLLADGKVIGWFQGPMEFGPRALGGRSILGDPRSPSMQSTMNVKIKQRESFRPFAPSVLAERAAEYFELDRASPYMLLVTPIHRQWRRALDRGERATGLEQMKLVRSDLPAVTHVDYSARVQTVEATAVPRFHALLSAFEVHTGCPVLINTSFNVRGEPIVCTPEDAYRCFMRTGIDYLAIENYLLAKAEQPQPVHDEYWGHEFPPD